MRSVTLCIGVLAGSLAAQEPAVAFEPAGPMIVGDPVAITARAASGTEVELALTMIAVRGRTWLSRARFTTDADGRIDLSRAAPKPGSDYEGADPLGPFSSLRLRRELARVEPPAAGRGQELTAELRIGEQVVASARLRRWVRAPGVEVVDDDDERIVAKLVTPPGDGPHPAVLVLGGSGGGLRGSMRFAELLASHGYAALALAYFGAEGLPETLQNIPLEYFDRALDWFAARPEVDAGRIAVLGGSKGGELALLLASRDERLKAVVANTPSSVVFQGIPSRPSASSWSVGGEPLPFVRYASSPKFMQSRLLVDLYSDTLDAASPEQMQAATIPVERIAGPVLLVAGKRDNMWPASRMCSSMVQRLRDNDSAFEHVLLDFDGAGHEVGGPGYGPARVERSMGGTPAGKARALAKGWARTLEFLARHLRPQAVPADVGERIDRFVAPLLADRVLSGALLIAERDRVVYRQAWGMADHESRVENTAATRFCIASISKPITAMLLHQLVDEGKLAPSDTVARWLPDFPRGDEITVDMLRAHRSGIPHRVTEPRDETVPFTAADVVERAAKAELKFAPGTDSLYSSAGYSVLARILELADGKPYGEMLQERICARAGMRDTAHADSLRVLVGRAHSYFPGPEGPENAPLKDTSFLVGAGSIWSTVDDLQRLCVALESGRLLSAAGTRRLTPAGDARWTGLTNGYASFVQWLPDRGVRVIFCGNMASARKPLLEGVLAILRGATPEPPARLPQPVAVDWQALRDYEGSYRIPDRYDIAVRLVGRTLRCEGRAMIPTGRDAFYYPERDAHVVFVRDAAARVTRMSWREDGNTWPLRKVAR